MGKNLKKIDTKQITLTALLFSLTIILSLLEGVITATMALPAGIKLGLANVIIMYGVFFLKKRHVYTLVFLKALFSLTRGVIAATLSFTGSFLSVTIMLLLVFLSEDISYSFLSILGAISHNIGQYLVAIFLLNWSKEVFLVYLPVLLISGVVMGFITSVLLKAIIPALEKLGIHKTVKTKLKQSKNLDN